MEEENANIFSSCDMPKRSFRYFGEIRNKKELCDFTIQVGSESIHAHRVIIMAVIPYFRDLLSPQSVPAGKEGIVLLDIDPSALRSLIEFAYTCQVRISEENVWSLLSAAYYLHVDEVRDACLDFLWNKLEPENALNVRKLLADFNCSDLSTTIDYYVRENFERVSQTDGFLECSPSYLKELIGKDDLKVTEEKIVCQSIIKWVKASPDNRKVHLPDLLTNVRMVFLKPLYLTDIVKNEELIRKSLECRDLIDEARNYILFPETRSGQYSFEIEPRKSMATAADMSQKQDRVHIWNLFSQLRYAVQHLKPTGSSWVNKCDMSFVANGGSVAQMDNKIYFFRWGDTLLFNAGDNEFKFLSDIPTPRVFAGASCLRDKIYLCGGRAGVVASNVVECFNPAENKWTKVRSMLQGLWGPSVVTLGGYIYVLGGQDHRTVYNCVERYDPIMDKWKYMPQMNYKRSLAGAAVLSDKIYICGGNTDIKDTSAIANSEVFNSITGDWKTITSMDNPRYWHFLLPLSGKLYAVGGQINMRTVNILEVYEPTSNKWRRVPSRDYKTPTSAAVAMPLGGT